MIYGYREIQNLDEQKIRKEEERNRNILKKINRGKYNIGNFFLDIGKAALVGAIIVGGGVIAAQGDRTGNEPLYQIKKASYIIGESIIPSRVKGGDAKIIRSPCDVAEAASQNPDIKIINPIITSGYLCDNVMFDFPENAEYRTEWPILPIGSKFTGIDLDTPYIKK